METIRSFIAIELPAPVKSGLGRLQEELKSGGHSAVKWVNPNSIHLTLKFLGSVPSDGIKAIRDAVNKVAGEVPPFRLEVTGLGVFPNPGRVRVIWVGVRGELDRLERLQKSVEAKLAPLGFEAERRPFTPHLTLARVRERAAPEEVRRFGQFISSRRFVTAYPFDVDEVSLMQSQLGREGAVYSCLGSARLTRSLSRNID